MIIKIYVLLFVVFNSRISLFNHRHDQALSTSLILICDCNFLSSVFILSMLPCFLLITTLPIKSVLYYGLWLYMLLNCFTLNRFVHEGSDFVKALGLCSVQFCGVVKSALLPELSPNLSPPLPPTVISHSGQKIQVSVSLSAGNDHYLFFFLYYMVIV